MGSSILASLSEAGGKRRRITDERAPSFPSTDDSESFETRPALALLQVLHHFRNTLGAAYVA
jgi:hypothetical protein